MNNLKYNGKKIKVMIESEMNKQIFTVPELRRENQELKSKTNKYEKEFNYRRIFLLTQNNSESNF